MAETVYRVLSLDAGGIRGVTTAVVVDYIEKQVGKPISEMFNLISGSSMGAFQAAALCVPNQRTNRPEHSAEQFIEILRRHKDSLFVSRWSHAHLPVPHVLPGGIQIPSVMPQLPLGLPFEVPGFDVFTLLTMPTPLYEIAGIEALAEDLLGKTKLSNALTNLLITSFEIECGEIFNFHNEGLNSSFSMQNAVFASGAVPAYFRLFELPVPTGGTTCIGANSEHSTPKEKYFLVDGGAYALDPALVGVARLKELIRTKSAQELDILSISIGAGRRTKFPLVDHRTVKSGKPGVNWLIPLVKILFEGMVDNVQLTTPPLTTESGSVNYFRYQTELVKGSVKFDDSSDDNFDGLIEDANELIRKRRTELDQLCSILTDSKPSL